MKRKRKWSKIRFWSLLWTQNWKFSTLKHSNIILSCNHFTKC